MQDCGAQQLMRIGTTCRADETNFIYACARASISYLCMVVAAAVQMVVA